MKKSYYIFSLIIVAGCIMTGCSRFLDAENRSAGGDDKTYLMTDAGILGLRNHCYSLMQDIVTMMNINEDGTDLYTTGRGGSPSNFQTYKALSAIEGDVETLYKRCYSLINNCNELIEYGNGRHKNDALFLRAWAYFKLTQQFGSVPYITEYINSSKRDYPRTELKKIYDNIITDLNEVANANGLPEQTYDGTVNRKAALALYAKVNLAAGWDIDIQVSNEETGAWTPNSSSTYLQNAVSAAEGLVGGSGLSNSFSDKWSQSLDYSNPETYFSVQYLRTGWQENSGSSHNLQGQYGSYYGNAATSGCKQCSSNHYPTKKALYLWDVEDERYEGTFMTTIYRPSVSSGAPSCNWPNDGYFVYYNKEKVGSSKISWIYGNANMTKADFDAKLSSLKDKIARSTEEVAAKIDVPQAYLMQDPVIFYSFKDADGTVSKYENKNYDENRPSMMMFIPPVRKYDDVDTKIDESGDFRPIPVLHASEMYLAAAEAYIAMGNDAKAFELLNKLRTRAKVKEINSLAEYDEKYSTPASFKVTALDYLLDERARETYAERNRWEDLRRTHQLVRYCVTFNPDVEDAEQMKGIDGNFKILRPIPDNEIGGNTGISADDQNPGFKAK